MRELGAGSAHKLVACRHVIKQISQFNLGATRTWRRNRSADFTISRLDLPGMLGTFDNLKSTIQSLDAKPKGREWGDYYSATNYSVAATVAKVKAVADGLQCLQGEGITLDHVWDLGANTGRYSRIAHDGGAHVVSFDIHIMRCSQTGKNQNCQ